jgi:hypothetical protein
MKARVVYESLFGNTRAVAEAVAEGLSSVFETETVEVGQAAQTVSGLDLIVIGGPTHAWSMSRPMTRSAGREQAAKQGVEPVSKNVGVREWLDGLDDGHGMMAATFDTGIGAFGGSAARGEKRQLSHNGYRLIDEPKQFLITTAGGATVLKPGELQRAKEWGQHLAMLATKG